MNYVDYFQDVNDFGFVISNRSAINLKKVAEKVRSNKLEPFLVDIAINGYTNRDTFDFEIDNKKWSDQKQHFAKGEEAQKDPEALTVKRGIRVTAVLTSKYINKVKPIVPLQKYNVKLEPEYCHLGAHFIIPYKSKDNLILMWQNFDKEKKTTISKTVERILQLRFQHEVDMK
jgi:hypothetical protein